MGSGQTVAVFGAYGHTGRFVVAELVERGFVPVLSGRDAVQLKALAHERGLEARAATVHDPEALERALVGAAAVINCSKPLRVDGCPRDRGGVAGEGAVSGCGG